MSMEQLFNFVQQGGSYCAPLLLVALYWLSRDRQRLLDENKEKDQRLQGLSEQLITISTELKVFLTNERKSS